MLDQPIDEDYVENDWNEENESMLYVKRISSSQEDVIAINRPTSTYGIHTPCIIDGHKVTAFVDGGASTSFVSRKFAEQHHWEWTPVNGSIKSALSDNVSQRVGVVRDKKLENGKLLISYPNFGNRSNPIIKSSLSPSSATSKSVTTIFFPFSNFLSLTIPIR